MKIQRLPILLAGCGLVLKGVEILLWRLFQPPLVGKLILTYDPGALWLANTVTPLFFDQRRIAPTTGEAALFEVFLAIGFGLECLLLGSVIQWLWRLFCAKPGDRPHVPAPPQR